MGNRLAQGLVLSALLAAAAATGLSNGQRGCYYGGFIQHHRFRQREAAAAAGTAAPAAAIGRNSTSRSIVMHDTSAAGAGGGSGQQRTYFDVAAAAAAAAAATAAAGPAPFASGSRGPVRTALEAAGLPSESIERAAAAFPGLMACHPHEEIVRRFEHLNFLIGQGVYTITEAVELVERQPRFLELKFGIVYEDADLFVMEKPADVRMDVPCREDGQRKWPNELTCSDWLDVAAPALEKKRFAHNLDSGTSGILVVSKNRETAARCNVLFSKRLVEKEYLALVFGHVQKDALVVEGIIEKDPTSEFRMRVARDTSGGGKKAQTRIEVLERGYLTLRGPHRNAPVTKLRMKPITGRRHQLRVHAAHIGHPMVGDAAYADDWSTYRLFLHAHRLHLPLALPERDLWLSTADPFLDVVSPRPTEL